MKPQFRYKVEEPLDQPPYQGVMGCRGIIFGGAVSLVFWAIVYAIIRWVF